MHLQVVSSPKKGHGPDEGRTQQERLLDRTAALRRAEVNIVGVAPELGGAHLRWVVRDKDVDAALRALAPWSPIVRPAFTIALTDGPGELDRLLGQLAKDYSIESVIVLGARGPDGQVLVSVGLDRAVEWDDWGVMGGWYDDEDHPRTEAASAS